MYKTNKNQDQHYACKNKRIDIDIMIFTEIRLHLKEIGIL